MTEQTINPSAAIADTDTQTLCHSGLSEAEKKQLFWACFLALATASFAFVFRVIELPAVIDQLQLDKKSFGQIFGASLWPVAITMILFSLWVDKLGYRLSIAIAFTLQLTSVVMTMFANSEATLYASSVMAGLGWGVIEAVINPVTAAIYKHDKAKMLNILHAAWPAGMVAGGLLILGTPHWGWKLHIAFMLLPLLAYGVLFWRARFPQDERVQANVPFVEMLKEFGGMGTFLATTFLTYEIIRLTFGETPQLLTYSLISGVVMGVLLGGVLKSAGKPLFFFLCVLMVPLATTELGTDAWIKDLMQPVLTTAWNIDAGWAIVFSAAVMMVLRFYAGVLFKYLSPPAVLTISCLFSAAGLMMLSKASGNIVFVAFLFYAVGQTYLWATMLGFVSERFPKGGALTLNMVTATGMLAVGIIGGPLLGAVQDQQVAKGVAQTFPQAYEATHSNQSFIGYRYQKVNMHQVKKTLQAEQYSQLSKTVDQSKRKAFMVAAISPLFMACCYFGLVLYFRFNGGYRPVQLMPESGLVTGNKAVQGGD
ncbi:MFS transporter [Porticoccaceae bacterium]|nr:MFS transporter [Porticoccaceae bacterium]